MATIITQDRAIEIAKVFSELVIQTTNIKFIYLYGSYAKGKYERDSDIDIAVVSDDFTGDIIDDTLRLMRIRRNIDTRIEPRPFRSSDFNKYNPIAREIMDTGVLIYS